MTVTPSFSCSAALSNTSSTATQPPHPSLASREPGYYWADMNSYNQQLHALPDYSSFSYLESHGLGRMPHSTLQPIQPHPVHQQLHQHPAQLPHQHQHPSQSHTQLPMLIMPSHAAWPSMLTNPPDYCASTVPSLPMPMPNPVQISSSSKARFAGQPHSHPRKTLTDDDRRRMCLYHQDHPHIKQTEIGAMFGVERSTVSKILRNKDKYFSSELHIVPDQTTHALKKSKGKMLELERALSTWARKAQRSGAAISDTDIWEQARHYARTVSNDTEAQIKSLGSTWLEKFKQKNGIGTGRRLRRRVSETNIDQKAKSRLSMWPLLTTSPHSPEISPAFPPNFVSPSSGSPHQDDSKINDDRYIAFDSSRYKHMNSQSTTSLSSAFTDAAGSIFSTDATMSPEAFTFSPDSNVGAFLPPNQDRNAVRKRHDDGPDALFQRPRSQPFPDLELEFLKQSNLTAQQQQSGDVSTTALQDFDPCVSHALQQRQLTARAFGIESSPTISVLRHCSSSGGGNIAAAGSPSASPSRDDARRAAEMLLTFMQSGGQLFDQSDYLSIVRLTDKLRLQQPQQAHCQPLPPAQSLSHAKHPSHSLGCGLSRIPETDGDVLPCSDRQSTPVKAEVVMKD